MRALAVAVVSCLLLPFGAAGVEARQAGDVRGWNAPEALRLVERARDRRAAPVVDSLLRTYRADATGHIYFFLDGDDVGEPVPLRVDQVALEMYWQAPDLARQVILGYRSQEQLPIRDFRYYIDRLTIVQNGFGDRIEVGEGYDVRGVPHPLAPGADRFYDFRVVDSLMLRLPAADPIQAYEVQVRPRDERQPAFVGSIFIDRTTADLVRMAFTFTPAAYVDRRVDRIRISLEHGLWQGRFWLPYEQRIEVRREMPELDFAVGTVIRGVLRVGNYVFNEPFPPGFFDAPSVAFVPQAERESYPFEERLLEHMAAEGLAGGLPLRELEVRARDLVRTRYLSGLPRLRARVFPVSDVLRFDRAAGLQAGLGATVGTGPADLVLNGGWAFAAGRPTASLAARVRSDGPARLTLSGWVNRTNDVGPRSGMTGALNSLSALLTGSDDLDPYRSHGGAIGVSGSPARGLAVRLAFEAERQENAVLEVASPPFRAGRSFRPVRPADAGWRTALRGELRAPGLADGRWRRSSEVDLEAGLWDGRGYGDARLGLRWLGASPPDGWSAAAGLEAGVRAGAAPRQALAWLGGRGTLPGHAHRAWAGRTWVLAEAEAAIDVVPRWVALRGSAALGAVGGLRDGDPVDLAGSDGLRASVGAGVGLVQSILRIDVVHGLRDGRPALVISVDPILRGIL